MLMRLTHANIHNDLAALQEVEGLLTELQQGFATALVRRPVPLERTSVCQPAAARR
jgi:flagellin-specific chaperone FliS